MDFIMEEGLCVLCFVWLINNVVVRTSGLLAGLDGSVRIHMCIPREEKSKSCVSQDHSEIESLSSEELILS
jgi:hypothetical protein